MQQSLQCRKRGLFLRCWANNAVGVPGVAVIREVPSEERQTVPSGSPSYIDGFSPYKIGAMDKWRRAAAIQAARKRLSFA
jgi:hypothetical protein